MSLFSWFRRKKDPRNNHTFTDEDRELARQTRILRMQQLQSQIRAETELNELRVKREKAALQQDIAELTGDEDDESEIVELMKPIINRAFPNPSMAPTVVGTTQMSVSYSDDNLRDLKKRIPKVFLKQIRKMTDDELKGRIKNELPNIDDDSMHRALTIVRE